MFVTDSCLQECHTLPIVGIARYAQMERRRLRDFSDTEMKVSVLPLKDGDRV